MQITIEIPDPDQNPDEALLEALQFISAYVADFGTANEDDWRVQVKPDLPSHPKYGPVVFMLQSLGTFSQTEEMYRCPEDDPLGWNGFVSSEAL